MADVTTVDIKSAWASKINWTQIVGAAAMLLTFATGGKFDISADQQVSIVVTIGVICNVATWIQRTWFTTAVTPSSIPTK